MIQPVSINLLAQKVHEHWLADGDRSYSPYNMPWAELPAEHRKKISRQVRIVLGELQTKGVEVKFHDEYESPGPGDVRWSDPANPSLFEPIGGGCERGPHEAKQAIDPR